MWRPATREGFDRISGWLWWAEDIAAGGGLDWECSRSNARHDVLAAEVGLRLADLGAVGTVLGESYATVDFLTAHAAALDLVPRLEDDLGRRRGVGAQLMREVVRQYSRR